MYHINSKGKVARCFAILKACPLDQHFENEEDGLKYVSEWEENRLSNPDLSHENIVEPKNNGMQLVSELKGKNINCLLPDGREVSIDTFPDNSYIMLENGDKKKRQTNYINSKIEQETIPRKYIGRAGDASDDVAMITNVENYFGVSRYTKLLYNNQKSYEKDLKQKEINKSKLNGLYPIIYDKYGPEEAMKMFGQAYIPIKIGKSNARLVYEDYL